MTFNKINELSENLNKGIQYYIDRLDMSSRDRELFYDLIKFSYEEGRIKGKYEFLNDINNNSDEQTKLD